MYFAFYERISLPVYITIRNTSRFKKRLAFCARCPSVGYAAQNAKPFRKFAKSNFGLEIGLFRKKVCGAICD